MRHIRKNDQVVVIAGRDKGKQGKVLRVLPDKGRVVVGGVNLVKRHLKPGRSKAAQQGGIIDVEAPLDLSNVLPWCGRCSKGTRVAARYVGEGGERFTSRKEAAESFGESVPEKIRKIRVCRRCGEAID